MNLLYTPSIENIWHNEILRNLKVKFPNFQFDPSSTGFQYPRELGNVKSQYYILSPENLSVSFLESHLKEPLTFETLPVSNCDFHTIHFNLSQHTNYFHLPDCAEPVATKNGIRSCLFAAAGRSVKFQQHPNHTFRYLQVTVSKYYLKSLCDMLPPEDRPESKIFSANEKLAQLFDLFREDLGILDNISEIFIKPCTSLKVNTLLLTFNIERLVGRLLVNMQRLHQQGKSAINRVELRNMEWVKEIISQQHNQKYTLAEVASLSNMSISKFTKIFKQNTGETFGDYFQRIKMENSMRKISGSLANSITDVAYEAGYCSLPQFTKAFKNYYGKAPSLFLHTATNNDSTRYNQC